MYYCARRQYYSLKWVISLLALWTFQATALELGSRADSDQKCLTLSASKLPCPRSIDRVCAKYNGEYISGVNVCNFCRRYGNTNAIILRVGPPGDNTVTCQPLHIGSQAKDDPECVLFFGQLFCTREYWPIRAKLGDSVVSGGNKCEFCSKYGNSTAKILSLGTDEDLHCSTMSVGCRANEIHSCFAAAQEQNFCTAQVYPVCAKLANGTFIQGSNECTFCTEYGTSSAVIISIGIPCETTIAVRK